MQKTIRLLPLLLLARCLTGQESQPPGKRTNNDSPIKVTDTTKTPKGVKTLQFGVFHEHLQQYPTSGRFFVHNLDSSGNDTHKAACLVPPTGPPVDLSKAKSWEIHFFSSKKNELPVILADHPDGEKKTGDIVFNTDGFNLAPDKLSITKKDATVNTIQWKVDKDLRPPLTVNPEWVVWVHYCPNGKCEDDHGKDLCK